MKKITEAPHFVFWILIPITILIGLMGPNKTFYVNIQDIYYVIGLIHVTLIISIIFAVLGFGYWVVIKLNGMLVNKLTLIHSIITIIGFLIIILIPFFLLNIVPEGSSYDFVTLLKFQTIAFWIFSLVVFIQLLYLFNIIIALITKSK
ncbi:hypothetical protein DFQ03_2111 [Maribacter caenipelagi]|uniref:Cytochrome C and Quinol oxidase polypeptide I n=1 Tax=Maribacter caenipelagi TaxID=1447781 RepID=A0A4R7D3S4_9FLAO|nr:hypothetical protein DFQ03_2111 [Maribacter caenipelagi]